LVLLLIFPTRTFATLSAIENRRKKSSRGLHVACGPYVVQAWINVLNEAVTMGVRTNVLQGGGGNMDILPIVFMLLTIQWKWTFTKRFIFSSP